jgi:hypothetical protein
VLKLVKGHKTVLQSAICGETETNPSHQFIDELIAQVKYTHLHEVWESRLGELAEACEVSNSVAPKIKLLKIL